MTTPTLKLSDLAGPDADGWSDVAVFVRTITNESERFVVLQHNPPFGLYYQFVGDHTPTCEPNPEQLTVRRLGRGRLRPARIEMQGEAGADLAAQLRTLANWKESQLAVESEWYAQAVGRLLQVPLGRPIRAAIQPDIETLQERVKVLREELRWAISQCCCGQYGCRNCESDKKRIVAARAALAATEPKPTFTADERLKYLCKEWGRRYKQWPILT